MPSESYFAGVDARERAGEKDAKHSCANRNTNTAWGEIRKSSEHPFACTSLSLTHMATGYSVKQFLCSWCGVLLRPTVLVMLNPSGVADDMIVE